MSKKFQNRYRIEPNRWQYWDYSAPGDYFITIISENRQCIFGTIEKGVMKLSTYGKIVENEFLKLNNYHHRAILDEYIIMPDHVHCIITLSDYDCGDGDGIIAKKIHEFSLLPTPPPTLPPPTPSTSPISVIKQKRELTDDEIKQYRILRRNMVLIKILGKFKQQTSKQINIVRNTAGTKNWQHDFYDHVIRDNIEFERIKNYIIKNPIKWEKDKKKE